MYTADVERRYKQAGEYLKAEDYDEALHLTRELEVSIPESPGVAMLEALNLFMLGHKGDASEACHRALQRVEGIRKNSERLSDYLNDAQRTQLEQSLDAQKTKVEALLLSLNEAPEPPAPSTPPAIDPEGGAPDSPGSKDALEQIESNLSALERESKERKIEREALITELRKLREADTTNTSAHATTSACRSTFRASTFPTIT